jgi:hypothetical protein
MLHIQMKLYIIVEKESTNRWSRDIQGNNSAIKLLLCLCWDIDKSFFFRPRKQKQIYFAVNKRNLIR